eukprot:m.253478 g.253478  ORF g.253478 m.253478 type:complete len:90 (-) comp26519_c0_seq2:183-452(-)
MVVENVVAKDHNTEGDIVERVCVWMVEMIHGLHGCASTTPLPQRIDRFGEEGEPGEGEEGGNHEKARVVPSVMSSGRSINPKCKSEYVV